MITNKAHVSPVIKILYIFLLGIGVFFIEDLYVLLGIIGLHLCLWFLLKHPAKKLKFLWKIKWFILIIVFFHSISGSGADFDLIRLKKWTLSMSWVGLENGLVMACKLVAMLTITQTVRLSMKPNEFIIGLKGLGLSGVIAESTDKILEVVAEQDQARGSGKGSGKGQGGGKGRKESNETTTSKDVLRGRIGNIPKRLRDRINYSREKFGNSPSAAIGAASLAVTLIRMVKIAPGLPLAPGHKNVLLVPVFIHGIKHSDVRFSGSKIGLISGILHFSMGFGKYGPLGIFQFALLGWVMDALLAIGPKKPGLAYLALVGGGAGLTRVSSEIILSFALGMPKEFYLLYLPYVISQTAFGAGSCFITKSILKESKDYESVH